MRKLDDDDGGGGGSGGSSEAERRELGGEGIVIMKEREGGDTNDAIRHRSLLPRPHSGKFPISVFFFTYSPRRLIFHISAAATPLSCISSIATIFIVLLPPFTTIITTFILLLSLPLPPLPLLLPLPALSVCVWGGPSGGWT